jgi:hypothetical protein
LVNNGSKNDFTGVGIIDFYGTYRVHSQLSVATTITRPPVLFNYLLYKEQQRLPPWRTSCLIRKTDDHGKYNDHLEEHGSGGSHCHQRYRSV